MDKGLVTATLATLATKTWKVEDQPLTGDEVVALYRAVPDSAAMCRAVGCATRSSRRFDRAVRLLQKAGLVRFAGGWWEKCCDAGG